MVSCRELALGGNNQILLCACASRTRTLWSHGCVLTKQPHCLTEEEGIRQDCLDELTVILAKPFAKYEASGDTLEVGIDVSTLVVDHESKV
jgi:hypothetical protein